MMTAKAHLHLIEFALKLDCTVSVFDGEDWQVKRSKSYSEIKEAVESVGESSIRIRDNEGDIVGWALIIPSNAPDETVSDMSLTTFMEQWEVLYALG